MLNINKTILSGCITKDLELKSTQSGMTFANFSLAINSKKKDGENTVDKTTFVDISCFGKTAEFLCRNAGKGCNVFIEGRLDVSDYTDKDGVKRKITKVIADTVQMVTWRDKTQQSAPDAPQQPYPQTQPRTTTYQNAPGIDQSYPNVHKYPGSYVPNYTQQPTPQSQPAMPTPQNNEPEEMPPF